MNRAPKLPPPIFRQGSRVPRSRVPRSLVAQSLMYRSLMSWSLMSWGKPFTIALLVIASGCSRMDDSPSAAEVSQPEPAKADSQGQQDSSAQEATSPLPPVNTDANAERSSGPAAASESATDPVTPPESPADPVMQPESSANPVILPEPPPLSADAGNDDPFPPLSQPLSDDERKTVLDEFITPDKIAAKAFDPPPNAKRLSGRNLWVDRKTSRVFADGYVAMRNGPLEMFACGYGTKEHESVVSVIAKASEIHAGLLAVGAEQGQPVQVFPEYQPATGDAIRVWVLYRDVDGTFHSVDAREWIQTDQGGTMSVDWVFAGSQIWTDPDNGQRHYTADGGDMICVSNFSTAMMDVPVESSAQASQLLYRPNTPRIPADGTPVRLVLEPIHSADPTEPPTEQMLPARSADPETRSERPDKRPVEP